MDGMDVFALFKSVPSALRETEMKREKGGEGGKKVGNS